MNIEKIQRSNAGHSKQYFCLFCSKLVTKFARHVQTVHCKEKDVEHILSLPKGNFDQFMHFVYVYRNIFFTFQL